MPVGALPIQVDLADLFFQKHYCDYCDVFLTHDSASVRKAHNSGRNHLANVKDYYAWHDKAQSIIDQITASYESSGGPPPGGFGFGPQHLGAPPPQFPPMGFGGPPGFNGPRPPFPPGPGFSMPPGGVPPFPPNGGMPPPGFGGPPPFPPNGAPPGGGMPPFPPNGAGGPPGNFNGPPPPANQSQGSPPPPNSGPSIHPDRLRMMGN
ncbi:hypothetical protein D9757_002636 [Collybiopsis confluens]|uniref:U1 small nuclear ribonucleoprotein C n=1 Tax=Collybiopsis confluens TaxID=2823264 RepID=A0A8H5HW88_9AGAR|nr:hypothetical protein D9757_002636 [Collybiopsis confluens]